MRAQPMHHRDKTVEPAVMAQLAAVVTRQRDEVVMAQLAAVVTRQRDEDVAEGRLIPQTALGYSDAELQAALAEERLFSVDIDGVPHYPHFFKDEAFDRRQLEQVCQALRDLDGGAKWCFFTWPRLSLGGKSPLEVLKRGAPHEFHAIMIMADIFTLD